MVTLNICGPIDRVKKIVKGMTLGGVNALVVNGVVYNRAASGSSRSWWYSDDRKAQAFHHHVPVS